MANFDDYENIKFIEALIMTPLQTFVHYLIILSFLIDLFSFVNVKPDLSRRVEQFMPTQEKCETCDDPKDTSKAVR
ncbi:MAG TPA: hypothetical protein DCF68_15780 [Cyanothece sp. UBA12306]|nr:hypothetical protein [Cyanothece sp. UBA12306]